jgi:hypothetical protein
MTWRDLAYASTGGATGIETAMNFIVSLVLAVAGAGVVAAIAYRGIQLVWSGERQHTGEWLVGLGLGGGLIAGCKIIGAQIVGFAAGLTLLDAPGNLASALLGYLSGDVLYYGGGLVLGMRLWWRAKQVIISRRAMHAG